ncbi:unnamed protein product [Phytophthora fragariaefolia]|uniref:Unnamed protein product n=1 Tax=Phytophthora fragariaefolia TaxID=1490495 RepID=A0A9W7CSR7_9STRA|nr:unnamed protein product [Phytophthora fragariaefolia]
MSATGQFEIPPQCAPGRTSSVSSEDLAEVLHELDAAGDTTRSAEARNSTKVPQNIHQTSHQSRNRPSGDDALTEVFQPLHDEAEEASHGDADDCDYEEKSSAGDMDTEDQSEDTEDSPKKTRVQPIICDGAIN